MDTHALSEPAFASALEVLAANGVEVMIDDAISATRRRPRSRTRFSTYNRGRTAGLADGIVITPSHNPPEDGGFKYNPPNGGPADTSATKWIEDRANEILAGGLRDVRRMRLRAGARGRRPRTATTTSRRTSTISAAVVDLDAIRDAQLSSSASIRWAARASPTGRASPSATASR